MDVAQFDFQLPEQLIALRPVEPRSVARMLVVQPGGSRSGQTIADLPSHLAAGDALVLNTTQVWPTQLFGLCGNASIGATLVKRVTDSSWWAFVRNAKRVRDGATLTFADGLVATARQRTADGQILLQFSGYSGEFTDVLQRQGAMPLPPYIASRRPADAQDRADYQTRFAEHPGSVAAPTASLHLSDDMLAAVRATGIRIVPVTLHVGAGTFLPVKATDTRDHVMHAEWGCVSAKSADALNDVRLRGGRIFCVGTTALRLIETAATSNGTISAFTGETDIFITPGYAFKAVDGLLTNFHLPKSTLFMLVSAFSGLAEMHAAYAHAVAQGYRFYSYGDACLLLRDAGAQ